ncbi:hypothetical protein EDC96DRAFT_548368 [Choanephora cucurbitarum]|nr:hypothetical protein EDC96DRAFT_548368 [Choanephora cucurbitarum]
MGIRDEQVIRLITSVEQNEKYLKQTREEVKLLQEQVSSLKDIIERQSILLDKIARGNGNHIEAIKLISYLILSIFLVDLHPGTISTASNDSLPAAAMISKPTAKDLYKNQNTFVHQYVANMISSLDEYEKNRVESNAFEQPLEQNNSEQKIYTYGEIPNEIKESASKSLRHLAVARKIPTNRCRDYWLEEDILSYLYRNRKRNKKSQIDSPLVFASQPVYIRHSLHVCRLDPIWALSILGDQAVGEKRPIEEEDDNASNITG